MCVAEEMETKGFIGLFVIPERNIITFSSSSYASWTELTTGVCSILYIQHGVIVDFLHVLTMNCFYALIQYYLYSIVLMRQKFILLDFCDKHFIDFTHGQIKCTRNTHSLCAYCTLCFDCYQQHQAQQKC